jgi:hypothetical protein
MIDPNPCSSRPIVHLSDTALAQSGGDEPLRLRQGGATAKTATSLNPASLLALRLINCVFTDVRLTPYASAPFTARACCTAFSPSERSRSGERRVERLAGEDGFKGG